MFDNGNVSCQISIRAFAYICIQTTDEFSFSLLNAFLHETETIPLKILKPHVKAYALIWYSITTPSLPNLIQTYS